MGIFARFFCCARKKKNEKDQDQVVNTEIIETKNSIDSKNPEVLTIKMTLDEAFRNRKLTEEQYNKLIRKSGDIDIVEDGLAAVVFAQIINKNIYNSSSEELNSMGVHAKLLIPEEMASKEEIINKINDQYWVVINRAQEAHSEPAKEARNALRM